MDETQTDEDARRQVLLAAWLAWGCPRGDKYHHLTREHAQVHMVQVKRRHGVTHDDAARVYRCRCGGWVWGRPVMGDQHGEPAGQAAG